MHNAQKSAVQCPFEYKVRCKAVCKVHYDLVQFSVDQEIHNLCECCPQKAEGTFVYIRIFTLCIMNSSVLCAFDYKVLCKVDCKVHCLWCNTVQCRDQIMHNLSKCCPEPVVRWLPCMYDGWPYDGPPPVQMSTLFPSCQSSCPDTLNPSPPSHKMRLLVPNQFYVGHVCIWLTKVHPIIEKTIYLIFIWPLHLKFMFMSPSPSFSPSPPCFWQHLLHKSLVQPLEFQ